MKFPGSKLLHHWDLTAQKVPLDELLDSCRKVALTGLAEVRLDEAQGMIFYYLGGEVNALLREGVVAFNGQEALDRMRTVAAGPSVKGAVSVYELPLDLAHLLRGIANRDRLDPLRGRASLAELLSRLERSEHTGTLEIQTQAGTAMVLVVRGRVSNTYWESAGGLTFEKGEARQRLEEALGEAETAEAFLAEFSREVFKSRHEVQDTLRSRLEKPPAGVAAAADVLVGEETQVRRKALDDLIKALPSVAEALVFDLITGAVLARRSRESSARRAGLVAEKLPALTQHLRELFGSEDQDPVEKLLVGTEGLDVVVVLVSETLEGVALVLDRAQPTAIVEAAVARIRKGYVARMRELAGIPTPP